MLIISAREEVERGRVGKFEITSLGYVRPCVKKKMKKKKNR